MSRRTSPTLVLKIVASLILIAMGVTVVRDGVLPPKVASCPARAPMVEGQYPNVVTGISAGDIFAKMSDQQIDAYMARVQALCAQVVRVDLKWDAAEPVAGTYDFTQLQIVAEAAARHRIYLRGIVDSAPAWAVSPECARELKGAWRCAPKDEAATRAMADFAGAATQVVKGQMLKVEVANEPNSMPEYARDPARYAAVYRVVRTAVKTVDPQIQVGPGGTAAVGRSNASGDGLSAPDWYRGLCAAGICTLMDVAAVHPYDWPRPPAVYDPIWAQIKQVHDILAEVGAAKAPIDITEMGFPTGGSKSPVSEDNQARYFAITFREFNALRKAGIAGEIDVYSLQDNASVPAQSVEAHFGLVMASGRSKPAWEVVHSYAATTQ